MKRNTKLEVRDSNPLLSVQEAAEALGVSVSTLWRMLRRGELQSVRRSGRRLVPSKAIERRATEPPADSLPPLTQDHPMWRLVGAFQGGGGPGSDDKHAILDQ